jgi:alkanesulfonate monooxygenase SsuD/methylene tetrahydromethanopterin reductase-like flavin-dependent oxidoreductase (luciferase family)
VAKLFEPLMTKNKLYSYEYLRNLMNMDLDPKDAPDSQLRDHHMVVVGNPDEVCRKLESFDKAGLDQVIMFKQAGRIPHQNIMNSLRLIGKHVLPHFNPHRTIAHEEISLAAAGR